MTLHDINIAKSYFQDKYEYLCSLMFLVGGFIFACDVPVKVLIKISLFAQDMF